MTLGTPNSTTTSLAARYGFRSVGHVHLVQGADAHGDAVAFVTGVPHRCPRTVRVPLRVAAELVAAGVPLNTERTGLVAVPQVG